MGNNQLFVCYHSNSPIIYGAFFGLLMTFCPNPFLLSIEAVTVPKQYDNRSRYDTKKTLYITVWEKPVRGDQGIGRVHHHPLLEGSTPAG